MLTPVWCNIELEISVKANKQRFSSFREYDTVSDWSLGVPRCAWACLEVGRNSDSETHRCVDY
jgi:hypothetical protein